MILLSIAYFICEAASSLEGLCLLFALFFSRVNSIFAVFLVNFPIPGFYAFGKAVS